MTLSGVITDLADMFCMYYIPSFLYWILLNLTYTLFNSHVVTDSVCDVSCRSGFQSVTLLKKKKKKDSAKILVNIWAPQPASCAIRAMNTHYSIQQQWYGHRLCQKGLQGIEIVCFVSATLHPHHLVAVVVLTRNPWTRCAIRGWVFSLGEWNTDGLPSLIIYFKSKDRRKSSWRSRRGRCCPGLCLRAQNFLCCSVRHLSFHAFFKIHHVQRSEW